MSKKFCSQEKQTYTIRKISAKSSRKIRAKRAQGKNWLGLGVMGLVGWSVAVPTLAGILVGIWIDSRYQSRFAWTIMLMIAGLIAGCLNIWYWLSREAREIKDDEENHHE